MADELVPVPTISGALRRKFGDLSAEFDALESQCQEYEGVFTGSYLPRLAPGDDPKVIREKGRLLVLTVTNHARALTWGLIAALNSESPVSAFLLVRAHLETTAIMGYLLWNLRRNRSEQIAHRELHSRIVQLLLAIRKHPDGTGPAYVEPTEALNVKTLVETLDKLQDLRWDGKFKALWEDLSEFCHPNFFSRVLSGQRLDGETFHFDRVPSLKGESIAMVTNACTISHEALFFSRQETIPLVEGLIDQQQS